MGHDQKQGNGEAKESADDILKGLDEIDMEDEFDGAKLGGAEFGIDEIVMSRIEDDMMSASIMIMEPPGGGLELTADQVVELLKSRGVTHGIDRERIQEMLDAGVYDTEVVVAVGSAPQPGADAVIEYKFASGQQTAAPQYQEDAAGRVDFRELGLIQNVKAGDLLAEKKPAQGGGPGMTVTGEELPSEGGVDVELLVGDGVKLSDDKLQAMAEIDGQVVVADDRISVTQVYMVDGDVDYSTGNIEFEGTIVVKGSMAAGFKINATGNVEIKGNVDKAEIRAGGSVTIGGSFYGRGEGLIDAGGDIILRSAEEASLSAGGSIHILQFARMSEINADNAVMLQNKKGSIMGGRISVGRLLEASNLGSNTFIATAVEVGVSPRLRKAKIQLENQLKEQKEQFETAEVQLAAMKQKDKAGLLPADKKPVILQLVKANFAMQSEIKKLEKKVDYLAEKMARMRGGKVKVSGVAHPGVKINTENAQFEIRQAIQRSSFYEQNEQVIIGSL